MKVDPRSFKGLSRFLAPSAGGPLADRALAEKLITPDQLQGCVDEQDRTGKPLDEILVARGFLKVEEVTRLRHPALPREVVEAAQDPRRVLGHYVLVSVLGTGGMAEVWKAWDRSLGRWVAVKELKDDVGHPSQRIEREGRMAGGLSHPGIITIFERGHHDGRAYLVMPFVDGSPPRSPLPPREAARLTTEVAGALAYAHKMGVIHRDVKPANILVEAGGRVVLADFGLAIPGDSGASRWAISGTPEFASPEQIRGDVLDARTDIYSLGATLYHLLTGRMPFSGRNLEEITDRVLKAPPPSLQGVPPALGEIVRKAMERDRARRFASMTEFADALRKYAEKSAPRKKITPLSLVLIIVAGAIPWATTGIILWQRESREQNLEILEPLGEAQKELAAAEQLRTDPEAELSAVSSAASRALPAFKYARALADGKLPEASAGMGRCYELIGMESDAEREYQAAGKLPAARLGLARIYLRRHFDGRKDLDWLQAARSELEKMKAGREDDPAAVLKLYASGRWAEALSVAKGALERERYNDVLQMTVGLAAIRADRWDEAVQRMEQAARLRRGDATSLYWKGIAHQGRGDRSEAFEAFTAALSLAPPGWHHLVDAETRLNALR